MSPLGSISNTQTSTNVLNTPTASSEQDAVAKGLKNPTNSVEVDLNSSQKQPEKNPVYDRAALAKQMNENKAEYTKPIDMSVEARDDDPENLVLVIDKKALDKAAADVVKAQEAKAAKEAEEAEDADKPEDEEEDDGISAMGVLGHIATVGTIVSLLI